MPYGKPDVTLQRYSIWHMKIQLLALCMLISGWVAAQQTFTLSGYVKDGSTGEDLIGANVYVQSDVSTGTSTNVYGFYSLTLPAGD
ncbi:MAG TPA: carboxypeptidase-like regulatory domain-containing protein, partial [Chitinophagales bacterium]|nr:carboxypeptidase-like regulatory domain-containing protein [Chitinophagales bacterium]